VLTFAEANEYVKPMSGRSQPHILGCTDGRRYVVKFPSKDRNDKSLASELLGSLLAKHMLLPVPHFAIVRVDAGFAQTCENNTAQAGRITHDYGAAVRLCFGSRLPSDDEMIAERDYTRLDEKHAFHQVENVQDFAGMLVFDQWTCNTDTRQVIYVNSSRSSQLRVYMIDQGYCFGQAWRFRDAPQNGIYPNPRVYSTVLGISSFEPWLAIIERAVSHATLEMMTMLVPSRWYWDDFAALTTLVDNLDRRRKKVRGLLLAALAARPEWFLAAAELAQRRVSA
jgi:hypothetical protein